MTFQDWLGLDAYIAYCRESWMDIPWVFGAFIIVYTAFEFIKLKSQYNLRNSDNE